MKNFLCDCKYYIMLIVAILAMSIACAANVSANKIDSVLKALDHEIEIAPATYYSAKESLINRLRQNLSNSTDDYSRFNAYKSLNEEYRSYQYDSAYTYARKMEGIAERLGNSRLRMQAKVALVGCFSSVGFFNEALEIIKDIEPEYLPDNERIDYYLGAAKLLQNMESFVAGSEDLKIKYQNARTSCYDSVLSIAGKDSYGYAIALLEKKRLPFFADLNAAVLCKNIINRFDLDPHQKAINYSTVGRTYAWHEKTDSAIYYLALSAIYDLRSCTRETTAAKDLATIMLNEGDVDRASNYINLASSDAQAYNSRLRKVEINSVMPIIEAARHNKIRSQRLLLIISLSVFAVMLAIVFLLFLKLRKRNRSLTESHKVINRKNEELEKANEALEDVNTRLKEANEIKDGYIIQSLYGKTDFVNEVEDKSRKALLKLKSKKYAEVADLLNDMGVREEQARMYASFDSVFLKLFPNFIEEFNKLLEPDARISLDGDKLPTEIRVFALVRLGFDSPADIAQYLGISVNTVYVYKAKIKSKCNVDKSEFEKLLKSIPKP